MVTIAICDDDAVLAAHLKQRIKNAFADLEISTKIEVFGKADDFEDALKDVFYDAVFLDIEIGNASGIDIGRHLRLELKNSSTLLFFISSYDKYHFDYKAYKAGPMDFLLKPISDTQLNEAIETITLCRDNKNKSPELFPYSFGTDNYSLQLSDIYYFRSDLRTKYVVLKDNMLPLNSSMTDIKKLVEGKDFIFVHRSYLVNAHHIIHYSKNEIIMRDGTHIQFSVRKQKKAMDEIVKFFSQEESTCSPCLK